MPNTVKTAKQPSDYTPSAWGANAARRKGFDFTTPSGQLCRIVPIPLEDLVLSGVIDNIDAVMRVVDSDIAQKVAPTSKKEAETLSSDEAAQGFKFMQSDAGKAAVDMMNKIVPLVVVEPTVHADPENRDDREDGLIYISDIDLVDRAAIFGIVMAPTEGAAQFRTE